MNNEKSIVYVSVHDIIPNRFQPRLSFDETELKELASSIKEHGIIEPLILRKSENKYEIIAGERRYKASQMIGLLTVPAIIIEATDHKSAELAVVENVQRKNLSALEEANSYKKLLEQGYTQSEIASKVGISQSNVANKMRLLNLCSEVQKALLEGKISERHARSLLVLDDSKDQIEVLNKIIVNRLTVKQTDDIINNMNMNKYNSFQDNSLDFTNIKNLNDERIVNLDSLLSPQASLSEEKTDDILDNVSNLNPFQEINSDIETLDFSDDTNSNDNTSNNNNKEFLQKNVLEPSINDFEDINSITVEKVIEDKKTVNSQTIFADLTTYIDNIRLNNSNVKYEKLDLNDMYQIIVNIEKK